MKFTAGSATDPAASTTTSTVSSVTTSSVTTSDDTIDYSPVLPCICGTLCPRHRITIAVSSDVSALTSSSSSAGGASRDSDDPQIEQLWMNIQNVTLNAAPEDASPMRQSGLLARGEYGEDEYPDLSHIKFPTWVVWEGFDGRRVVHGVYPDWGRAGQVTQGISQARHMRYDRPGVLWEDWRDAHLSNNGRRAFKNGSTLWNGSLLGPVVTRAELVTRIRDRAYADGLDPDDDDATAALVSQVLLPAIVRNPPPPVPDVVAPADYYFVVIRGRDPGLWFSREEYNLALGRDKKRWGYVAPTEERAQAFLVAHEDKLATL